ncbi:hypothetical protein [Pseudomonas sp. 18175]|uniref:hypothetical protein n=1 Tax=Pseudomonas sp. 18175 TaxID=3390056 RepID=UPI003D25A5AB
MQKSHSEEDAKLHARPLLPEDIGPEGVTQEYLDAHKNKLTFTVEQYAGQEEGDVILLMLGGPGASPAESQKVTRATGDTKVPVAGAKLHRLSNGVHAASYLILKKNIPDGPSSYATLFRLLLV